MLQVSFVVKAVSALTAAFRLVQLDSCGQVSQDVVIIIDPSILTVQSVEVECLRSVSPDLHNDILDNLHKLSFTSMAGEAGSEAGGTRHHFTKGGRLVASKQIIYTVARQTGLEPVSRQRKYELRSNVPDIINNRHNEGMDKETMGRELL